MVHTLERSEVSPSDGYDHSDGTGDVELPTNRLNSSNLRGTQIEPAGVSGDRQEAADDPAVDWVQRLSKANPVTELLAEEELGSQPVPSGMRHHETGPARMVPAKKALLPKGLKRLLLTLSVVLILGGSVGGGIYALIDSGWLSTLFAPQVATTTPPISGQQVQATAQAQPSPKQEPTQVPQPDITASAEQLRDKGIEQYKLGNFEEAIKQFEGAVNVGTNDARTYYHMGLAYLAVTGLEHSLDDAELAFRTATSLEPAWAAAHAMLAESLVRRGYYSEAILPAIEATRLSPNSSDAWLTLSRAYKGAGQEAEATRAYAEASRLAPSPPMQP
ncbi:MAG TPA: tetratricopeptide repeat protein [Chloroflexia bacterium]|nr:tetratricopeptide repeat protein [Chloroflexia bacterium]